MFGLILCPVVISSSSINLLSLIFRLPSNTTSPTTEDSVTISVILTSLLYSSSYLICTSSNKPSCHKRFIALGNSEAETVNPFLSPEVKMMVLAEETTFPSTFTSFNTKS